MLGRNRIRINIGTKKDKRVELDFIKLRKYCLFWYRIKNKTGVQINNESCAPLILN